MALSLRRANAVKDALVRDGVPAQAITVIGKGGSCWCRPPTACASRRTAASRSSSSRTREQTKKAASAAFFSSSGSGFARARPFPWASPISRVSSDSTVVGLSRPWTSGSSRRPFQHLADLALDVGVPSPCQPAARLPAWRGKEPEPRSVPSTIIGRPLRLR